MSMNDHALDRILAALNVEVNEVSFCEFAADSAVTIGPEDAIEVHFVLGGTLFVETAGGSTKVSSGGIVLVPPGTPQRLAGTTSPEHVFDAADVFSVQPNGMFLLNAAGESPATLHVVCGHVRADVSGSFGPLQGIAGPISSDLADDPVVRGAFEAMLRETRGAALGSRVLIGALMKACLVLALRQHAADNGIAKTLPGLFERPSLARAVAMVVEDPAAAHSLNGLARASGMSRSNFAKAFVDMLDVTPMEFVTRTRLARGRELLLSTALPIGDIASAVGFSSRSHFSRAFRNHFGADPTTLRRSIADPSR